jgi:hypothetical protein
VTLRREGLIILAAIVLGVAGGWFITCQTSAGGKLERKADSLGGVYSRDTATWSADTLATDSVLADTTDHFHPIPPRVKVAVKKERQSARQAIKTAEKRQEVAEQRLRVAKPTLRLFGELASDPVLRAGVVLRVKGFDVQVYGQARQGEKATLNLGIRKELRIF